MSGECKRLAAGAAWPTAPAGSVFATSAAGFEVAIAVLAEGDTAAPPPMLGEEVGAILDGSFRIDAAGETYRLGRGEAIVIPPDEPRTWTCLAPRGVLYRAIVTRPAEPRG